MVHELGLMELPDTLAQPGRTRLAAIAVQIMPIMIEEVDEKYPPAILWHMPRDQVPCINQVLKSTTYLNQVV